VNSTARVSLEAAHLLPSYPIVFVIALLSSQFYCREFVSAILKSGFSQRYFVNAHMSIVQLSGHGRGQQVYGMPHMLP
jgi:hypothetical protein